MSDAQKNGFLRSFENPFFVVVVLLGALFVGAPFLQAVEPLGMWRSLIPSVVAGFALVLGIAASRPGRRTARVALAASILIVATAALGKGDLESPWETISRIEFAVVSMIALVLILRFVLRARTVRGEEIFAAIASYLLLGLFWSYLYVALHASHLDAPAFRGLVEDEGAWPQLSYFSFVTLTTLGYGEIVPANSFARSLATFEAVTGQLFIAVLLARLVALQTMNQAAKRDG